MTDDTPEGVQGEPRSGWSLSHIIASCHVCEWAREQHQHERDGGSGILAAARRHATRTGHYVGVERGQVTGYGPWDPGEPTDA